MSAGNLSGNKRLFNILRKLEQADCDFIDDYIDSIDRWEYSETDSSLFWIVEEEVLNYLSGGQDIDSTISMIPTGSISQRVNIL